MKIPSQLKIPSPIPALFDFFSLTSFLPSPYLSTPEIMACYHMQKKREIVHEQN